MIEWFSQLSPVLQALLATLFTWFVTALGAATVFLFKELNRTVLNSMLGFAAGVMIAASYFSLLAPAIEMAADTQFPPWLPATVGFLAGGGFLWMIDKILPHLHFGLPTDAAEGLHTGWHRVILLVLAITLHNFPEGLAVGVAFGAVAAGLPSATLLGAVALAIGIGYPKFPGGGSRLDPAAARGFLAWTQLLVRAAFRHGRAGCRRNRRDCRALHAPVAALCPGLCGGSHDLRCCGRPDPGSAAQRKHRCCHGRCACRLCFDDGARCSPGLAA